LRLPATICSPLRILDCGSGFSSWIFRQYQKTTCQNAEVISVDADPLWLDVTREYVVKAGLSDANLRLWEDFIRAPPGEFDFILWDLGDMAIRLSSLARVVGLLRLNGILVLDDMQQPSYGPNVRPLLAQAGKKWLNLMSFTSDKYGRYAMAAF